MQRVSDPCKSCDDGGGGGLAGPSQALPDGSLYASAVGPPSADKTTWASHVDDMLELERQLNALGA